MCFRPPRGPRKNIASSNTYAAPKTKSYSSNAGQSWNSVGTPVKTYRKEAVYLSLETSRSLGNLPLERTSLRSLESKGVLSFPVSTALVYI